MTGANLGLSLTLNLEQYEDMTGYGNEAGVVVCTITSFLFYSLAYYFQPWNEQFLFSVHDTKQTLRYILTEHELSSRRKTAQALCSRDLPV